MLEDSSLDEAFDRSENAKEAEVTLLGDRNIIINVVCLLSYIRNAIKNKKPCDIRVGINKTIDNSEFEFVVNNSKVDDLIVKETIDIN